MTNMATAQEYRSRAKECVELSMAVRTSEQRIMLQHIASTWLRLADEQVRGIDGTFFNEAVHEQS